jgi:transcriptional regulator with XRE-family HTH domain
MVMYTYPRNGISKENIRRVRKALGLSQANFANLLGIQPVTVSKWERGVTSPTLYQAELIKSFGKAVERKPSVSEMVAGLLVAGGIIVALSALLNAAFGDDK